MWYRATSFIGTFLSLWLLTGLLAACGFQPLYQQHHLTEGTSGELARIKPVSGAHSREQQLIRIALEDLFQRTELDPYAYTLRFTVSAETYPTAVNPDGSVARFNVVLTAHYALEDAETGTLLEDGDIRRLSSHNVVDSDYATMRGNRAATERAIRGLAEALRNRMVTYFRAHPAPAFAPTPRTDVMPEATEAP